MTFHEIAVKFENLATVLGLDFGYAPFKEGAFPKAPFMAFSYPNSNNFGADNKVYVRISRIAIMLITAEKDVALEESVEKMFRDLNINYSREEDFYADEDVFVITYETEELINA